MAEGTDQTAYLQAFVQGLVDGGIKDAVVCPGSRSTPLTVLLANRDEIRLWMEVDERSAGFFALGMAKAQGSSVVLVASSGTATANYYPAVVEASLSDVPLVVITADRPPELRDVGAPQVIDQVKLFSGYVKAFAEMATASTGDGMVDYAWAWGRRAAEMARSEPMGPVHCNFPLRDPLVPDLEATGRPMHSGHLPLGDKMPGVLLAPRRLDSEITNRLRELLEETANGIIVAGIHPAPDFNRDLLALARRLQYPVLADPLSQLRSDGTQDRLIISGYDAFLREPKVRAWLRPDVILRFGPMPVSKYLTQALNEWSDVPQILVDKIARWRDPNHARALNIVDTAPSSLCRDLAEGSDTKDSVLRSGDWSRRWIRLDEIAFESVAAEGDGLWEGSVMAELARWLPDGSALYVGNSMPIRDLDTFWKASRGFVRIWANRGANGIDGVVSSALGASTKAGPLVLVLGDLSFYHDFNGLLASKLYHLPATIVLLNNDGGGIFSFLPQSSLPRFEELFAVPLGLDFSLGVSMYDGKFVRVRTLEQFREQMEASLGAKGLTVIEVPSDREQNVRRHRALWSAVGRQAAGMIENWEQEA